MRAHHDISLTRSQSYLVCGAVFQSDPGDHRNAYGNFSVVGNIQKVDRDIGNGAAPSIKTKKTVGHVLDAPGFDVGQLGSSGSRASRGELWGKVLLQIASDLDLFLWGKVCTLAG